MLPCWSRGQKWRLGDKPPFLPTGDVSEEEVVAFGEKKFWLGGDEIAVASGAPGAMTVAVTVKDGEGRMDVTGKNRTLAPGAIFFDRKMIQCGRFPFGELYP